MSTSSTAPRRRTPLRSLIRPERRRRRDVGVAASLVLLSLVGVAVLWRTSAVAGTDSRPAVTPVVGPPAASGLPDAFVEVWRAPSSVTAEPVVAGPAVVTADGSTIVGRDARTGEPAWSYARDRPLCTVGAGFPSADAGNGRVLAYYARGPDWCSELTALRPDTGARITARNPDVRPGTRLVADGPLVVATGADYLEAVRSDLVKTLEYGAITSPEQVGRQPRTGCVYGSVTLAAGRLGVIERCPGEQADRLTVLDPDHSPAEKPEVEFSVLLPGTGATLVALSAERAAVALRDPARLLILDRSGAEVATVGLDVPAADLAADPPGGLAAVRVTDPDGPVTWWTGSRTVALDPADLTVRWTLPDALGPGVGYAGTVLVPVPEGLAEVDPVTGAVRATRAVDRAERTAPVRLATQGEVLLEQRGPEVVALVPG